MNAQVLVRLRRLAQDDSVRRMVNGGLASLLIKVGSAGLTYVMFVLLARAMEGADFGRFSFGFNTASLLSVVAGLGLHIGILRWWPEYRAKQQPDVAVHAYRWAMRRSLLGSLALGIILALTAVAVTFITDIDYRFLVSAALLIGPICLAEYLGSILRAQEHLAWALLPKDIFWRLGVCLMAVAALVLSRPLDDITALGCTAGLLVPLLMAQWFVIRRKLPPVAVNADYSQEERSWIASLIPIWLSTILYAFMQFADVLIVGVFLGPEASGAYFSVARTASLLSLMLVASNMISAPLISKHLHSNESAKLQRSLQTNSVVLGLPTLASYLFLVVFGDFMLGLFDQNFGDAYVSLVILATGQAIHALSGPMSYIFHMSGNERLYLKITGLAYAIMLIGQVILIPLFGLTGAAIATTIGYLFWNACCRYFAYARTGIDPTILNLFKKAGEAP